MNNNVLVLGTLTSEKQTIKFLEAGIRPAPADIVQKYLIEGLCNSKKISNVEALCSPRLLSYPYTRIKDIESCDFYIGKAKLYSCGYKNYIGVSFIHRERNIVKKAKEWANKNRKERNIVLIYSVHTPFLHAAYEIKKIAENTVIALIVPDLPHFMGEMSGIKKFLKSVDKKRINYYLKFVDKYILYTKYMANYFNLEANQWVVCEGMIDSSKIVQNIVRKSDKKICIYAGSLQKRYAIDKLVKAFERANIDAELHLYGNGEDAKELLSEFVHLSKTKYMGILSQNEIFQKMKEATLLINPRPSELELTKYSCPSKTFEYMASGTPILMTRLAGLPSEYEDFLYFFDDESEKGFVDALEKTLSYSIDELQEKGIKAARFLANEKNSNKQVQMIIDFCNE